MRGKSGEVRAPGIALPDAQYGVLADYPQSSAHLLQLVVSHGPGAYWRHSGPHRDILVPDRTPTTTLTVTVEVRDELNAFIKALAKQEGCDTTQVQLIGALVHGTTPGLASYMVGQYVRHRADQPGDGDA